MCCAGPQHPTKVLPALLLAAAVSSPSPAPTPKYTAADVQRIELRSSWGGFGRPRFSNVVIERVNSRLQVDDYNLDGFLAALAAPAQSVPQASQFGLGDTNEDSIRNALRDCVGDAADLSPVLARFAEWFRAAKEQQRFLSTLFFGKLLILDDYPAEEVTVTLKDGSTMKAESTSQLGFMLPFKVTVHGSTYETFDPALSIAVSKLNPADVNVLRLEGYDFYEAYGAWLCKTHRQAINAAVVAAFMPKVGEFVRHYGVEATGSGLQLSADLSALQGEIHLRGWPARFTYKVSVKGRPLDSTGMQAASLSALERVRVRGSAVLKLPWMQTWLENSASGAVVLSFFTPYPVVDSQAEVMDYVRRYSPRLYKAIAGRLDEILFGTLSEKATKMGSQWLFLPDGRAVLVEFYVGDSPLGPLSKGRIKSFAANPGHEDDTTYPWRVTITAIDPEGAEVLP